MKEELKSIKDLVIKPDYRMAFMKGNLISEEELKEEAIKWIKEDIERYEREGFVSILDMKQINEWMKRLNIKEEDLK